MSEFYCPEHRYNPPANSGFSLCPHCEIKAMNEPIPEAVAEFLKEHDCGKYKHDPDRYGDDWSHYDIEALVDLAINLGNQLSTLQQQLADLQAQVKAADNAHLQLAAAESVFRDIGAPYDYGQTLAVNIKRLVAAQKAKHNTELADLHREKEELLEDIENHSVTQVNLIARAEKAEKELATSQRRLAEMINMQMRSDDTLVRLRADVKPLLNHLAMFAHGSLGKLELEAFLAAHPEFKE